MRLSSFLPVLLLVGALRAHSQCSITDLTATVSTFSPNCEYYVVLNFNFQGTTNQFTVKGNGVNYGTFSYGDVPVALGPFTAGVAPVSKEFIVQDAVFQDCGDEVEVQIPGCGQNACDIFDVQVGVGDCILGTIGYEIKLNFKTTNPGGDFFELWASNGTYLGFYPLSALPIQLPYPWGGGLVDALKICIKGNPNCCETVEFEAPDCVGLPCDIANLKVTTGNCTSDSTYQVKLNFELSSPSITSQFGVWANNEFLGIYGLDQLPLVIDSFPWDGGPVDFVKVCLLDVNNPSAPAICCKTVEFHVPECLPIYPCGIKDLKVEADSCTSDSTFGIFVNFSVNDPSSVDSFQLWGNGEYIGAFAYDSLPLYVPDFPWNKGIFSFIKVCTGNAPTCCKELQFLAPDCLPFGPCEVTDIKVKTGACTSDSTYKVLLNFQATNPGNGTFIVWANGEVIDTFPLTAVPLALDSFPWGGDDVDVVKICIGGLQPGAAPCCAEAEFHAPDCLFDDKCAISNIVVDPGNCSPDGDFYKLFLNFEVKNPGNDFFEVWAGNGQYLGIYPISELPITIPEFPCYGDDDNVAKLKICINDNPDCCAIIEFNAPDCCDDDDDCEITDLTVETGDCNPDGTYQVWLNFEVQNPPSDKFGVWANGGFLGSYSLDSLPLYIPNFPTNGGPNDVVKVCFVNNNGATGCCKTLEFEVPDCVQDPCEIEQLTIETGECTSDSTYEVWINFEVANPPASTFGVWANGQFLDTYSLDSLPLYIADFPWDGGPVDFVKICFINNAGGAACCKTKEFHVPDCLDPGGPCKIDDLSVEVGECTSDSTYEVWVNFWVDNPSGNTFQLWANGEVFGTFSLDSLPLYIPDFPWNGQQGNYLKVCIVPANVPPGQNACCAIMQFLVPDCLPGGDCEIYDVSIETGDCTGDSTYQVWINFQVANPPSDEFGVWANGEFLGTYSLDSLPLYIPEFPWNGGSNDVVKICFANDPAGQFACCCVKEFHVPDCLDPNDPCEIYDLKIETGECTSDSTYEVWVNFEVENPPSDKFGVWANGEFLGFFELDDLPVYIQHFPWNGGSNDVVKVCMVPNSPNGVTCCRTEEFEVPDCLGQDPCKIYDLHAIKTPCLCGQFFVALTFEHKNGGSEGFDIVGNGNNYGNFPYNTPQPIILGPFDGNGTTEYEFAVQDKLHPDCADDAFIGKVDCMTPAPDVPDGAIISLSPNPTTNWLNVTAQMSGGVKIGEASVEIRHADGRLVRTLTVPDGSNFQLDVTDLPAGIYRLSLLAAAGRAEGTFAKQ